MLIQAPIISYGDHCNSSLFSLLYPLPSTVYSQHSHQDKHDNKKIRSCLPSDEENLMINILFGVKIKLLTTANEPLRDMAKTTFPIVVQFSLFRHNSFRVLSREHQTCSHLGPMHQLFSLPGTIFQISMCYFPHIFQVFTQNLPFLGRIICPPQHFKL